MLSHIDFGWIVESISAERARPKMVFKPYGIVEFVGLPRGMKCGVQVQNGEMRKRYLSLTNGDRRHAVVSCLVAARQFLEHELKPPARHACYAMFGQQCCRPLRV